MKTPIQELHERLWEADKDKFTWNAILKEMLDREKTVIETAFWEGRIKQLSGKQYYNETFNTKEK